MMIKSDNVKRIRREMVDSMRRRKRVDDDSDLEVIVLQRMSNSDATDEAEMFELKVVRTSARWE